MTNEVKQFVVAFVKGQAGKLNTDVLLQMVMGLVTIIFGFKLIPQLLTENDTIQAIVGLDPMVGFICTTIVWFFCIGLLAMAARLMLGKVKE